MRYTAKYLWLTAKHRWFVMLAGLRIGCPLWRLVTHDLSKFRLSELPHYGRQFFGNADDPSGFIRCWLRHQNRNDHHWEWWIPRTGHNRCDPPFVDGEPLRMSSGAMLEMMADWMGASRAYSGSWPTPDWQWLATNNERMQLHPETRRDINRQLTKHGFLVRI
jgi:hypothetical protein